jgi:hypothetical protein
LLNDPSCGSNPKSAGNPVPVRCVERVADPQYSPGTLVLTRLIIALVVLKVTARAARVLTVAGYLAGRDAREPATPCCAESKL